MKNKKNTVHTVYRNKEKKRIPSVTTIIGQLAKPQLIPWANGLGLKGIEYKKYMDDVAIVGTLVHEMIQGYFTGGEVDLKEYSQNDIERANNSMKSFYNWVGSVEIKPIKNEIKLESDKFGGTTDMLAEINGELNLVDFKTGNGIYDDYFIQLAGYNLMLKEYKIKKFTIVRVGRDEHDEYEVKSISNIDKYEKIFKLLLKIYELKKETT
jgi:hypothetical protein